MKTMNNLLIAGIWLIAMSSLHGMFKINIPLQLEIDNMSSKILKLRRISTNESVALHPKSFKNDHTNNGSVFQDELPF